MIPSAILHETSSRLRMRLPEFGGSGFHPAWLESWLESLNGVLEVRINKGALSLIIGFDPQKTDRDQVLAHLAAYQPDAAPDLPAKASTVAEMAPMVTSAATLAALPFINNDLVRQGLTLANISPILLEGVDTLVKQGIKMEVLDALAVGLSTLRGEVYTANITAFLLALGEYLERETQRKSDRRLRELLKPKPTQAWVERDGALVQIDGDQVRLGDIVVVGVGETIPVDGRVIEGLALVNQAAVTGEDVPVRRETRQRVVAGSQIIEGRLRIEAKQVGADTTTARVASFIQNSLANRSDTQRMAEDLANKRVWLTLGTGGLVYALTRDLTRLESIFLVDYSCALKLGTPMAFKSGMYKAANHGVLMRGGSAIEHLSEVDTIVFDKTGTLTHSELEVTDVISLGRKALSEDELLALVASVEEHASHPLAQAVVEAAKERDLQHISHGEVDYLVAHGLATDMDGKHIIIGSRHFLEEHHAIDFARHEEVLNRLAEEGKTLLYVGEAASDRSKGGPIGLVALRDTLRDEAAEALARLRDLGIRELIMISGDRISKAEALAKELGLDRAHGEVIPEDKAAIIQALQAEGRKVAFVGDGINDGPALSVANVGISMPKGADIARATADIVLLDDHLTAVADALEIAQGTMKLIKSNFNLAVGINTALLGGAVFGWVSPVMSALLHNGTTIGVLLRALAGAGPKTKKM